MSKVTVNPKALAAALSRATGGIDRSKTYPILQCVRLSSRAGQLTVEATDLDRAVSVQVEATGDAEAVCIDYSRLISIVATVKDREALIIDIGDKTAVLSSGRSRFTVPFLEPEAWPNLDETTWSKPFEVSGPKFSRLMTALDPAIYLKDDRTYLCGIYLASGAVADVKASGCLTGVATDGHKLYARHIEGDMPTLAGIIVPKAATVGIAKIFAEFETIELSTNERKLKVRVDGLSYITKLIDGQYPDWRRILPKADSAISYDAASLRAAAELVETAKSAEKSGKAIKLVFGEEETQLESRDFNNPDFTSNDVVPHSLLSKPLASEVGINVDYLIQMLDRIDAETVELSVPAATGGAVGLRSATHTDRAICIMSMRV